MKLQNFTLYLLGVLLFVHAKANPGYSLEELMLKLKLKLQYFDHFMQRADALEKILMLEKIEAGGEGGVRV